MVLTDLPYGTTRNHWDSHIPLDRLWPELLRVTTPSAPIVMTAQMPFTAALVMSQPGLYRHHWVWEKGAATGHLNAKRAPMKAHEDVLVFSKKAPYYNPQMTDGHPRKVSTAQHKRGSRATTNWGAHGPTSYDSTRRYPRSVQFFSTDKQKHPIHSTQKPVALFEYLIRTYSPGGATVLDVAAGSGTTAIAAERADRDWICIEKDRDCFEDARDRIERAA
jgi:site-specific DNA-methyltransferase (adenine-specific)